MRVGEAKQIARDWVMQEVAREPAVRGAFFAGSTNWKADDEVLPLSSDVDVKLIVDNPNGFRGYFKQAINGILLEVSYGATADFRSAETVLSNYFMAKHFTTDNIIYDASGTLAEIQATVKREFAARQWVQRRRDHVWGWLQHSLTWLTPGASYPEQVFTYFYPLGVAIQLLAVADLQNPTVRQMAIIATKVCAKYDLQALYDDWLELLGSRHLSREQVEALAADTLDVLEIAQRYSKTPFFGSSNLTDYSRPLVAEGFYDFVRQGYPREAVAWLAWHQAWSQKALDLDAPDAERVAGQARFQHFLSQIGFHTPDDLYARHRQLTAFAPRVFEATEQIIAANPDITD